MSAPYKTLILGLPRSMTYWTSRVLGFDHDVTVWPVSVPRPGACDTAFILLPREEQARYYDGGTKFVYLRRAEDEVRASLLRYFPEADPGALSSALAATSSRLREFFAGRPHLELQAPLTPEGLSLLASYLNREPELPGWVEALAQRMDRMDDPLTLAELRELFLKP